MPNRSPNINPVAFVMVAVPVLLIAVAALHSSDPSEQAPAAKPPLVNLRERDAALERFAKSLFPNDKSLTFIQVEPIPTGGQTEVRLVFEGRGAAWYRDPRAVKNDAIWNRVLKQEDYFMGRACGGKDDALIQLMGQYGLHIVAPVVRQPNVEGPQFVAVCNRSNYNWGAHRFD